jgi:flagellin
MALGVLNNLSAIYAENNLNNTSNSLQTVLEQLSSGSKINSGADDAAGLSLVNGLKANQSALTQSETNATEGVGLLQVADGALSQVTSLLDRAITLATEASNGTLNSSQDSAANQEYQSILSEVNNIGQTTTYNQEQVFDGSTIAIYTGDSSTAGSSIDDLNIRSLSEASVGDTGGAMAYSDGSNNVFLNLSTSTTNAQATDTLNASGTTTINVNYLVKGNGTESTATTAITVGGTSGFANTANGMISAINDAGLGLTASFATQAQAGVTGGGTQTGIEITGGLVSAGVDPSASSTSGTLDLSGISSGATLALGSTVIVDQGANTHTFTINSSNNTLATLAGVISGTSGLGVTASVITNGDGTQSLSLADTASTGGALSVTTTAGTTQAPIFGAGTTGSTVSVQTQGAQVAGNQSVTSQASSVVVGASGTNSSTDTLTLGSSITIANSISNDAQALTFVVGEGTNVSNAHTGTFYTGSAAGADTLAGLASAINAQNGTLGVYATVGTTGLTLTTGSWNSGTSTGTPSALGGENLSVTGSNLTSSTTATQLSVYSPQITGQTLVAGTAAVTVLDNGVAAAAAGDILTGSISISNSYGSYTFTAGPGTDTANTFYLANHGGNTYTGLVAAMTAAGSANLGYTAAWNAAAGGAGIGGVVLTATAPGANQISVGTDTLANTTHPGAIGADAGGTGVTDGTDNVDATSSTAIVQLGTGNITDASAVLGGALSLTFNGNSQVFIMGSAPSNSTLVPGAIYTGANTVGSLVSAINSAGALGLTASDPGGGTGGIYLQGGTGVVSAITMNAVTANTMTPLGVTTGLVAGTPVTAVTGAAGNDAVDNLTATNNSGEAAAVNTSDAMSGSITVVNGSVTDTFNVGTGADSYSAGTGIGTYYTNNTNTTVGTGLPGAVENYGNTLAGLASLVSAQSATLGVTAQANASGLTLTQSATAGNYTGYALSTSSNTLMDVAAGTFSTATTSNQLASESDTLSGALVFSVGTGQNQTVTMAQVASSGTYAPTAQGMIDYINANSTTGADLGISAAWVPNTSGNTSFGSIQLTSMTEGTTGTVNVSAQTSLTDTTATATLSYTPTSAYNTGLSGAIADSTTGQTAAAYSSDSQASSGIATMSYTDASGESLSGTDLNSQSDAQIAVTKLNAAITDAAAQDGYIGAQINTLEAVSQVMSTQQENVTSAQNAIQATDYASATSNMSKYEILSQTGIAALAQANSVQQEVTKLLQ